MHASSIPETAEGFDSGQFIKTMQSEATVICRGLGTMDWTALDEKESIGEKIDEIERALAGLLIRSVRAYPKKSAGVSLAIADKMVQVIPATIRDNPLFRFEAHVLSFALDELFASDGKKVTGIQGQIRQNTENMMQ